MSFEQRVPQALACKECGEIVKNVNSDVTSVVCWKCVNVLMTGKPMESIDTAAPPETCKK